MAPLRRVTSGRGAASARTGDAWLADGQARSRCPARRRPPGRPPWGSGSPSEPDWVSRAGRCCTSPWRSGSASGSGQHRCSWAPASCCWSSVLGVRPGVGTVLNVLVIGVALNAAPGHVPVGRRCRRKGLAERLVVLVAGIPVFAVGLRGLCGCSPGPGAARRAHAGTAPAAADRSGDCAGGLRRDGSRPRVAARRARRARHRALRRRSPDRRWPWRSGCFGCVRCRARRHYPGRSGRERSREPR